MDPRCATAVRAAAAGRQISDERLSLIEDALRGKMRELARRDRQAWQALTRDQRVAEASRSLMEDVQADAALKEYRASLQVLRAAEANSRIAEQKALFPKASQSQSTIRDIQNSQIYSDAVRNEALAGLGDLIDAAASKDGTGVLRNLGMRVFNLDNPMMTADIIREVFANGDGHTGNAGAKVAAQAWLQTIEGMRQRFNAAGGNIGKLAYGYLSQVHDAVRVADAGPAEWARRTLPLLDREQYVRPDGQLMNDGEVLRMLEAAHETISERGANKTEPGQFKGAGARANRGSDHRVLHFKDGDAWIAYMQDFGEGSLYDAMLGHVSKMARDIGLVERYGPNPEQWFRVASDIAERADTKGSKANRFDGNTPQAYWDILTGKTGMPENRAVAAWGQDIRNVQTAAKLGGAVLSSTTDVGTIAAALHFNRLPYFDMLANLGREFQPGQRSFLRAHAVIAENLAGTLNRFTGDHMTHSLTGRVAQSVMHVSLMNAWTDGLRAAFSATMMQGFAKKIGKAWGQLDEWDRFLMQKKGITEADWQIISAAEPSERNGVKYLTGDAIRNVGAEGANQAATKWMAFVSDEAQFAVVNPDMATRAIVTGGGMPAGTLKGEAMRSFAQFKSFPLAMLTRHWRRALETPQGLEGAPLGYGAQTSAGAVVNRVATLAMLNVTLMMLGAIVLQNKNLVSGKDPYDIKEGKFWMRALAQGGGAGYLGDLLFKDPTDQRSGSVEQTVGTILGPAAGAVAGLVGDIGVVNAWQVAKGKDTKIAAEALKWTNSQLPYVGLWETRALWEHAFLFQAQEALNPGYLQRVQRQASKDWGTTYWWSPYEQLPDRAPDLSQAWR